MVHTKQRDQTEICVNNKLAEIWGKSGAQMGSRVNFQPMTLSNILRAIYLHFLTVLVCLPVCVQKRSWELFVSICNKIYIIHVVISSYSPCHWKITTRGEP